MNKLNWFMFGFGVGGIAGIFVLHFIQKGIL
jgi:hypothetical protein